MKPYYFPQFKTRMDGEDLYVVMESLDRAHTFQVGEPKPYHEANDEAGARNDGSWGKPTELDLVDAAPQFTMAGWLGGLSHTP